MAILNGFLEILDPVELGICTDPKLKGDVYSCRSVRSIKMLPSMVRPYQVEGLVSKYGRDFWKWARDHNIAGWHHEMCLAFEFPQGLVTPESAERCLQLAFIYGRHMEEVIDAVASLESPVMTGIPHYRRFWTTPLTGNNIGYYDMQIRWHSGIPHSTYVKLIRTLPITSDNLVIALIEFSQLETLRWIVDWFGHKYVLPIQACRAFALSERSTVEYISKTIPHIDFEGSYVRYDLLDLVPASAKGLIKIMSIPPDRSWTEQAEWFTIHLSRCPGVRIEFPATVGYELLEILCSRFGTRINITIWALWSYEFPDLRKVLKCLKRAGHPKLTNVSLSAGTSSEMSRLIQRYCSDEVKIVEALPSNTSSPVNTWDFSQYTDRVTPHMISLD